VGEVEVSQAASVHPRYPVPSLTCLLLCVVHSQLVHLHKRAHTQTQYSMVSSTTVWLLLCVVHSQLMHLHKHTHRLSTTWCQALLCGLPAPPCRTCPAGAPAQTRTHTHLHTRTDSVQYGVKHYCVACLLLRVVHAQLVYLHSHTSHHCSGFRPSLQQPPTVSFRATSDLKFSWAACAPLT
jgi:hypothetical protein